MAVEFDPASSPIEDALVDFLDYMDNLYGPPSEEGMAEVDRRLEEM